MQQPTTPTFPLTIGLDLGSKDSQCAIYGSDCERIEERKVTLGRSQLTDLLGRFPGARVVMEASTASRWINNLARELGHEVIIANPRNIPLITASVRKCDRNDARLLGELGQIRPELLSPVLLRDDRYQEVRTLLFARMQVVRQRAALVFFVRSEVRVLGHSLPSCGTKVCAGKCRGLIPACLRMALNPILDSIQNGTDGIKACDKNVDELSDRDFSETAVLRQVHGVGPLIALAFVATIGDPARFPKSRTIGAYLGLVPRMRQSGKSDPALSITKHGDRYMRSLLVSAATRILGPHGADSDLADSVDESQRKEARKPRLQRGSRSLENWVWCSTACSAPARSTSPCATLRKPAWEQPRNSQPRPSSHERSECESQPRKPARSW